MTHPRPLLLSVVALAILTASALVIADDGAAPAPTAQQARRPAAPPPAPRDMTPLFCDIMVFEVNLSAAQLAGLDAQGLAAAHASAADLEKALAALGPTRVLHRLQQPVSIEAGMRARSTSDVPIVTREMTGREGEPVRSIARQDQGITVELNGRWIEGTNYARAVIRGEFELSAFGEGTIETSPGVKAPVFRRVSRSFETAVQMGRAELMISADAAADGTAAPAYVIRLLCTSVAHNGAR
ncbi:MAG: hypothetical protein HRU75_00110 [Planctomycetia bacterium]|nr:MAG: hypothetical protein HRU75_00110 [Planctomycetia bacterium]